MDEVFEAFISARNVDPSELGFEDNFSKEEVSGGDFQSCFMMLSAQVERCKASERQSKRVVRELKSVLVTFSCSWKSNHLTGKLDIRLVNRGSGR